MATPPHLPWEIEREQEWEIQRVSDMVEAFLADRTQPKNCIEKTSVEVSKRMQQEKVCIRRLLLCRANDWATMRAREREQTRTASLCSIKIQCSPILSNRHTSLERWMINGGGDIKYISTLLLNISSFVITTLYSFWKLVNEVNFARSSSSNFRV